jgi:hypothetical protein
VPVFGESATRSVGGLASEAESIIDALAAGAAESERAEPPLWKDHQRMRSKNAPMRVETMRSALGFETGASPIV